ncbi:Vps62-related protein [Pseudomonas sp. TH41]|uniref:Vps62-related protein n=1 Tax=Pseudomonas sp. TH41 TaxID=2796405 RepID=UPI001913DDB1|nr:Vps62-related protein [Pseudomonas sp. TH41]MBK5353057.1 Vps62-related protein [Pseudomonas sp. TH41]
MNTDDNVTRADRPGESIKYKNLLINFTTEFNRTWNPRSASKPGVFWRPAPAPDLLPGFFPLGDMIESGEDNINGKRVAAVVCEGELQGGDSAPEKALSRPDDYEQVWRDSGLESDGALWRPIPPDGYVALGLVSSAGDEKPSLHAVRCVRADLVIASSLGDSIWNNWGSGTNQDFGAWHIKTPVAAAGEIYFAPGTFVGFKNITHPSTQVAAYSLRIQIPLQINPAPEVPVLSGFIAPAPLETSEATQIATLPWFAVEDDALRPLERLSKSPHYQLERTDRYVLAGHGHNTGDKSKLFRWTAPRALVRMALQLFTRITSIEVTTEWPIRSLNAGRPIQFSARLSKNFTHTETSSSGWTTSKALEVVASVPKNEMVAVYQLQSHYQLRRKDGTEVAVNFAYADRDSLYFTDYPPKDSDVAAAPLPVTNSPTATDTAP